MLNRILQRKKWIGKLCAIVLSTSGFAASAQIINYEPLYNSSNFSRSIDLSKPVGVLEGQHSVTPSGAATYSIPIKIAPGTNGLVPSISISYNSQTGNGLVGYGWNLGGISMITAAPHTLYYDNVNSPSSVDDNYLLDGSRLLKNPNSQSDNAEYLTEVTDFTLVRQVGGNSQNFTSFAALSKDGKIAEYGSDPNARVSRAGTSRWYAWYLNKVTDESGNYMTYNYTDISGEKLLSEIRYTGNDAAGLQPYNSVKFIYGARKDENTLQSLEGVVYKKNLLQRIEIYAEGTLFRTYEFTYGMSDNLSFLKEVKETNGTGTSLNATSFKYGDLTDDPVVTSTGNVGNDYSAADVNGDGFTDIIVPKVAFSNLCSYKSTGYKVYAGNASGSSLQLYADITLPDAEYLSSGIKITELSSKLINPQYQKVVATDFDGDGRDDILRIETFVEAGQKCSTSETRTRGINILYSKGNRQFAQQNYTLPNVNNGNVGYELFAKSCLQIGDFDGDKIPEVMLIVRNPWYYYRTKLFCFKQGVGVIDVSVTQPIAEAFDGADQIFAGDFDGDGDMELYLRKDKRIDVYALTFNGSSAQVDLVKSSSFAVSDNWDAWPGDFNGDGLTDMFIIDKDAEAGPRTGGLPGGANFQPSPAVAYSNGTGFDVNAFNYGHSNSPVLNYSEIHDQGNNQFTHDWIVIGDYNGDGKSDVLHEYKSTLGGFSHLETYYSLGYNAWSYSAYEPNIAFPDRLGPLVQVTDVNGDNRNDIFTGSNLITIRPNVTDKLLEKVRTGLGNETSFEYSSLSQSASFSNDFTAYGIDLVTRVVPITNVMRATTNSGLTGISPTVTSYYYKNPVLHLMGKGFIGFMGFKAVDSTANKIIETQTKIQEVVTSNPRIRVLPAGSKSTTSLIAPAQTLSVGEQTITLKRVGSSDIFATDQTMENGTDYLSGVTTTAVSNYDNYDNVTSANNNVANGLEQTTTSASYVVAANGYPYPSKPDVQTITSTRQGNASVSSSNKYTYGAKGLLTTSVSSFGLPNAVTTNFTYSLCGNITQATKTANGVPAITGTTGYDSKYRFATQTTNNLGQYSNFTYDPKFGGLLTARGIDGLTTTNVYNSFGDLIQKTSATGVTTDISKTWDVQNGAYWYSWTAAAGSPDVKKWYDGLGREIRTDVASMNNQWTTQRTTYDARGNVNTKTNTYLSSESPLITTNAYDEYNRLKSSGNSVFGTVQNTIGYSGGNMIQTTTDAAGRISTRTTDAAGRLIKVNDNGGQLNYSYNSRGNITIVAQGSNTFISNIYDVYGQKIKTTDFSSGITTYEYDAYGRPTAETDARNNRHTFTYNQLGDIAQKSGPEGTTTYTYYSAGNGLANQLKNVTAFSGVMEDFTYDNYGRIANQKKTITGQVFQHNYTYNAQGQVVTKMFPSGYTIRNSYDGAGYLTNVRNDYYGNPYPIYTAQAINGSGQATQYTLANGIRTDISYYYGLPTSYVTNGASIQNYSLSYDYTTGNITRRADNLNSFAETFTYDNLDRLTQAAVTGNVTQPRFGGILGGIRGPILGGGNIISPVSYPANTITYDQVSNYSWGNIKNKSDVGDYDYKKHAVYYVSNAAGNINTLQQDVSYTPFNRPASVSENGYQQTFLYDDAYDRAQSVLRQNGTIKDIRFYMGDCDIDIDSVGSIRYIQYVAGGDGLAAIVVMENGQDKVYSVYKDHLGSILKLTDNAGTVVAEQNFDAWGRKRNPADWSNNSVPAVPNWLIRGYTGHEDMPQFGLINMNARLYDPLLGRMLSPDDYVSNPSSTQDYNRYTYAHNNPLKYIDPDGNNPFLLVGAGVDMGLYLYHAATAPGGLHRNFSTEGLLIAGFMGAWQGGLSYGIGEYFKAADVIAGTPAGCFYTSKDLLREGARALMHGGTSFLTSGGNPSAFYAGAFGSVAGSLATLYGGSVLNSDIGSSVFSAGVGGAASAMTGGNFVEGAATALINHLANQLAHKMEAVKAIWNKPGEYDLSVAGLLRWYMVEGGADFTPGREAAWNLTKALQNDGQIIESLITPVRNGNDAVEGLYSQDVSTYNTSSGYALGSIKMYFILNTRNDVNGKYLPVGFSDYYNFDAHTDRSPIAEAATTLGRAIPGVYYNIRYGITPPQWYIDKYYKH
ncbi:FG-GAP-like repeat-containing protein [Taibaiella soli]|uniref:Teneurin-like YD-shell domain-containing protein n=1 Tax=Taibaiella soli TaxID=1649169 RepID=A0A2W2AHU8_9BACT|nr:FG-GAP-like repeat-containing protein [Taibaiella soli]PZF74851.1 hypothetical protein DN068_01245 [Taibaiella soli]